MKPMNIPARKPRNPFVAASLRRAAGAHKRRDARQEGQRSLRQELNRLRPSP